MQTAFIFCFVLTNMPNCAFYNQFRLHPLVAAILLTSLSATAVFAEPSAEQNTTQTDQPAKPVDKNSQAQAFFDEYYIDRQEMNDVQIDQQRHIPESCRGTWVTPIAPDVKAAPADQSTTVVTANYAYYDPEGNSELSGDVSVDQPGRSMHADKVTLDKTQTVATGEGNVVLADAGLVSKSDSAVYHLNNESGQLQNSAYISEAQKAHGQADLIDRQGNGVTKLKNATYSTCEPTATMPWKIKANEIELNENTGRGVSRHTKLYIRDVPILNVPYFNFPIDDRRTSGFLVPTTGYTNDGGIQLTVPYYLNLAPNYDLTLTPRYLNRRGGMLEGDFRYLLEDYGTGRIEAGYLPSDQLYDNQDRKRLNIIHDWKIDDVWRTTLNWNYLSDKDYYSDLGNNPSTTTHLNQERNWSLYYHNGIPGLDGLLRVQTFQTVDPTTLDADKPYSRLPQLLLNYRGGSSLGLQYDLNNDSAYFKKSINDGSALENSGARIYNRLATRYNYGQQWGYIIPELSVRTINTIYDRASIDSMGLQSGDNNKQLSVVVPQFTLDTAAVFEREGSYLQSLTPRFFYAYSPYSKQDNHPNFDTTTASLSYDQLFSPSRFYGHDRLDDNNFASLGITYRAYDPIGLERLRLSLGESYYFNDRKVRLRTTDPIATANTSGPALAFSSQLNKNLYLHGNSLWKDSGENSANDLSFNYINDEGSLYSAGYFYRRYDPSQNQQAYKQATASFIQPLYNQWRVMGYVQYDLAHDLAREWLLGVNYDACCWRVSLYGRSYYNDLDDPNLPNIKAKRAIMVEISLKGLAGFSGNLNTLLQQKISGYQQVESTWNER